MSGIKLVYFDIRGRAEFIRMVLEAAGQKYEDVRYSFEEWPQHKSESPYGQLPWVEYQGKLYGQSNAIAAFFAREFGFFGKTNLDGLRIGEVVGLWEDQIQNIVKYRWTKDETQKAEFLRKALEEDLPKYFGFLEKLLKDGGSSGYFVNNALSLADLYVYDMGDNLLQLKKDALESYPLLQKLRHNVEANPKLKTYLANRKETIF
ncbi:probable glutathione S-transferase 7 isoform X2 [Littorina saxatilis]|uniref:Glutathione S-transferase n=1 Tax=Littorina saxatilis TaxID=31220 RepID=A0AAN9BB11_9CAEN